MASLDLSSLSAADFEPRRNEFFVLRLGGTDLSLKLVRVENLGAGMREGGAFALRFAGESGPFLRQGTYSLVHAEMGQLEIFLVPLGPGEEGNLYEAVFT